MLFYPWGDVWQSWGSGGYNFAEMPYNDVTTNTDLTTARVFGPNFGRWFTPDPDSASPDASDPQTWNMYAYVRNNPTTLTDPEGTDYIICTNDENGSQICTRATNDVAFQQALKNPGPGITVQPGSNGSGTIYTTDPNTGEKVQEGTYQWVPPTPQEEATVDATNNLVNLALAVLGVGRTAVSFATGTVARIVAGEAAEEGAEAAVPAVDQVVAKAASAVGGQEVKVASEEVAKQAADKFLGPAKEVITDRQTGAFAG